MNRARVLNLGAPLAGGLAVSIVALVLGVVWNSALVVGLACLVLPVVELALHRVLASAFPRQLDVVLGELFARTTFEQALLLVFVVRSPELSHAAANTVLLAVVAYQAIRVSHTALRLASGRLAVPRVELRNVTNPLGPKVALSPLLGQRGVEVLVALAGLPALGLVWAGVTGSFQLVAPAAVVMAVTAVGVVGACLPSFLAQLRRPRGDVAFAAVHEAVLRHRPRVVLYSVGGPDDLHWVTSWHDTLDALGTLDALDQPALVMIREIDVLDLLPPAATPVVCIRDPGDVQRFSLPDAHVALYPANSPENLRLLRDPGLRSAFVGHGDSDKAVSANPVSKMYDEIWVAGEAGRDRYLKADVGIRPEQIKIVGRPQVRRVRQGTGLEPGAPCSVLYAPTWEGLYRNPAESSLLHSGREIVRRLLSIPGVRVLYRPHPKTGTFDPRFAQANAEILADLSKAGPDHRAVAGAGIEVHDALNMADVLVADISAVISDFLASGKPYVVVNGTDLDTASFQTSFPSASGGHVVGRGGEGLEVALADIRESDSMRSARARVRSNLIGPATDDPVGVFARAIDTLAATLPAARLAASPPPTDGGA